MGGAEATGRATADAVGDRVLVQVYPPSPTAFARGPGPAPGPSAPPGLSLVLPAYHEERRIGPTLDRYVPVVESLGVPFEVLVTSSGGDRTPEIAGRYASRGVVVQHSPERLGKGAAIMAGFRRARYAVVGYADADGAVPPEELRRILQRGLAGDRAVIASRRLDPSRMLVREPRMKGLASDGWHALVRTFLDLPVQDAECGLKVMAHDVAARVTREVTLTNWIFDSAMLYHIRASGEPITEISVTYRWVPGSHFRLTRIVPVMMAGLIGLFAVNRLDRRLLPMKFLRIMAQRFSKE